MNVRVAREKLTVAAMVGLYCRAHHRGNAVPCPECAELLDFADERLDRCPYRDDKPACNDCPTHCYRADVRVRERIREVMRFSGPRMIFRHPLLALYHQLDRLRSRRARPHPSGRLR